MFSVSLNFTTHLHVGTNQVTIAFLEKNNNNNLNSLKVTDFEGDKSYFSKGEKKIFRQIMEEKKNEHV